MAVLSTGVQTLGALLEHRAQAHPDREIYRFLIDGEQDAQVWTLGELAGRARGVAAVVSRRAAAGDRVLLSFPEGNDFAAAFLGCCLAGVIAVPAPAPRTQSARLRERLRAISEDAGVRLGLTHSAVPLGDDVPVDWVTTDTLAPAAQFGGPAVTGASTAYLQYTSGSTRAPRGVVIRHTHALANCAQHAEAYRVGPDSVMVAWVPTHHDLGLLNAVLLPLFGGFRCVSMSPGAFVQRPARWLRAIAEHGGTHSVSPNFGLDLAVLRSSDAERAGLDLRTWRHLLNGAEPIRQQSEARFSAVFAAHGLGADTLSHAFGMSEATAILTAERPGQRGRFARLDAAALSSGRVVDAAAGARAVVVAGNGPPVQGTQVRVVDPGSGVVLAFDRIGEVWVRGPGVGDGYWGQPTETEALFGARSPGDERAWLRTGDLGFVRGGDLYITGRHKDLIIVRGENHAPQDLEWSVEGSHPALRPHAQAAFAVAGPEGEALGLIAEVYPDRLDDPEAVFGAIREAVGAHGLQAQLVVLTVPGGLAKTASGKVQRQRARAQVLAGEVAELARFDAAAPGRGALDGVDLGTLVRGLAPAHRPAVVMLHVRRMVAALTGVAEVDPGGTLTGVGLDSIRQIELVEALAGRLGIELPGSTVRDHPTLAGVVAQAVVRL